MPGIERRYEGAMGALTEVGMLAIRLAISVAQHDPKAKETLRRLRQDHINAAFRLAGDDASVKHTLEELDQVLGGIVGLDKSQLPEVERRYRRARGVGFTPERSWRTGG